LTGDARVKHFPKILLQAATPFLTIKRTCGHGRYLTAGGDFLVSETLFSIKSVSMTQGSLDHKTRLAGMVACCALAFANFISGQILR
jgi:hypothetical protein